MIGELNMASVVLGLMAWILPVVNLLRTEKSNPWNWIVYFMISTGSLVISLLIQIYHYYLLIKNNDIGALIDTNGVVPFAATFLFVGAVLIHGIVLISYRSRTKK